MKNNNIKARIGVWTFILIIFIIILIILIIAFLYITNPGLNFGIFGNSPPSLPDLILIFF